MQFEQFFDLVMEAGPAGLAVGLGVLIFVYLGSFTDFFKNGNLKRWAAFISAMAFSEFNPLDPGAEEAMIAGIGILAATLAKVLVELGVKGFKEIQAKAKA